MTTHKYIYEINQLYISPIDLQIRSSKISKKNYKNATCIEWEIIIVYLNSNKRSILYVKI